MMFDTGHWGNLHVWNNGNASEYFRPIVRRVAALRAAGLIAWRKQ